jgi:phage N-6-adenine-methyltransferase
VTLLKVRPRNHPQQVKARGAAEIVDDRRTPDDVWRAWHNTYRFTIDVAASAENAKLPRYFDIAADGLSQSWTDESVWCNPPYSNIAAWVKKAWREMARNHCRCVVMLVPANRTEQRWWQEEIEPYRDGHGAVNGAIVRVKFLARRMRFTRPGWTVPTKGDRPPFGCALLIWEPPR